MVAKWCPGWWPTCNGTLLSRGLLPPEWNKNLDVCVPPLSKPIHSQLDPPAGEHLFVSMTIRKHRRRTMRQSFQEAEFSLTKPLMKRQNKQLLCHSPVSKKTAWQGVLLGQNQTSPPAQKKYLLSEEVWILKSRGILSPISMTHCYPSLLPMPVSFICIWMDLGPRVPARYWAVSDPSRALSDNSLGSERFFQHTQNPWDAPARNKTWVFSSVVTVTSGILMSEEAAIVIRGHSAANLVWKQESNYGGRQDGTCRDPNPGLQKRDKTSVETATGTSGTCLSCPSWWIFVLIAQRGRKVLGQVLQRMQARWVLKNYQHLEQDTENLNKNN